jgi:hypothetical protein
LCYLCFRIISNYGFYKQLLIATTLTNWLARAKTWKPD